MNRKNLRITFIVIINLLMTMSVSLVAQDTLMISDLGLLPNTRENATPFVNKAMAMMEGKQNRILYFPQGRYDFWPHHCIEKEYFESNTYDINPKRLGIVVQGLTNVTIEGNGSEFIFHDRMQPVTVDSSSNVSLKNFSVDWDIPLTAQGEVISSDAEGFTIRINTNESPYIIENNKLVFVGEGWKSALWEVMEFQPDTRFVEPYTGDAQALGHGWQNYMAKEVVPGLVKVYRLGGFKRHPKVGNWLVLRHSTRDHAGMFLVNSKDIDIEGVRIYHTAGLGVLSQYSENISLKDVKVVPNKAKGRFLSGHDDGFHFMGCKGQITVDNCEWAGLMDDPINVHGTCVRITEILSSHKIKCRFMHDMSAGLVWGQPGEQVGFIENKSMRTVGFGTIEAFETLNKEEFTVQLSAPIPEEIKAGAALENLTWTPDVDIRNSMFGSCRARGLLLSTPGKIVVENNCFQSSGSAILIAGDANYWYESGAVRDVTIQNNTFEYPCMSSMYQFCEAIISILPEIPEPDSEYPFHRNITITNNTFHPFDYPILYAKSVDGLRFTNNTLIRSIKIEPFHKRQAGITLDACKNVSIKGNEIEGDVLGKKVEVLNMDPKEVKMPSKEYFKF
ncbi:right-handed parallel beta-helix repeat-containing protein [Carboxylicivirga sp. A043]|uniref:right-handed parallel beta-helix repeat-containing protein n=1 Tax=Carboxylicivirga litoralis TaxID=2816963 RepID=UPI0021CB25E5|nr:right-handed parallel beta-helix repeat-containing protein [Carboxylicivirga sp. A043]MCU4157826.1 right-handed parallel beta-helix repeat-containing protein [Carboxylicivirga sp. A043]